MKDRLQELEASGWRLTRDGSTATAFLAWDDPEEPDCGWELMVLHTAGHARRFSLEPVGSGLTERGASELPRLRAALDEASFLLAEWNGELPPEEP